MSREWTNVVRDICIEGCCFIDIEYGRKHSKHSYLYNPDTGETKKIKNDDYDPSVKREKIPEFCEKSVGYNCLVHRCPFLTFSRSVSDDEPDGGIEPVHFIDSHKDAEEGIVQLNYSREDLLREIPSKKSKK